MPHTIDVSSGASAKELAEYLGVRTPDVIAKLMERGLAKARTQSLPDDTVLALAADFGRDVNIVASDEHSVYPVFSDAAGELVQRAPVIAILGHVNHGKTTLLDAIRHTEVADSEAGGITQHIGACQVKHGEHVLTFLDTPGHEAFTAMRSRGAGAADVAVIVVAADDGVKPQTREAIDHAVISGIPILVVVTKIDKPGAQPDRAKTEMAELGLTPVAWGGNTEFVDVSAKTKVGLDDLLDTLTLMVEIEDLRAKVDAPASGTVIESRLEAGRGPVLTALVSRGTLKTGDCVHCGEHWGRVRALHNLAGERVQQALPGEIIEVLGLSGIPEAGEHVHAVESEREARRLASEHSNRSRVQARVRGDAGKQAVSAANIFAATGRQELRLVLKADVRGSLEVIENELAKLPQDEVAVSVLHAAVGPVSESDITTAAGGLILAFGVGTEPGCRALAQTQGARICFYSVIYRVIEDVRAAMADMLSPNEVEEALGTAEVRDIYRASHVGVIAGCHVTTGKIVRDHGVRLLRGGTVIYDGEITSLQQAKSNVREVNAGFDCGLVLAGGPDVEVGDIIDAYITKLVKRTL